MRPTGNGAFEELLDLLRQRGGGDVVIARLAAQQEIAHAAAHPEGGKPGVLQPADDRAERSDRCTLQAAQRDDAADFSLA